MTSRLEGEPPVPEEVGESPKGSCAPQEEEILSQIPAEARLLYLLLNDPESGGSLDF